MHTKYLKCANGTMELPAMVAECKRLGVQVMGVTDHLNALEFLPRHRPIRDDILALATDIAVYFGVELNYQACDGAFAYSDEIRQELGFQFAIGGIHSPYLQTYDLREIVEIQHRHHLKTCADPLVQVLVHPYWFGKKTFDERGWPWFNSMKAVSRERARELGQAARDSGTAIEINGCANLDNVAYSSDYVKEYIEYLGEVASEGCLFSVGSDAHDINRLAAIEACWRVVEQLGLPPERIWRPTGKPLGGKEV
jgi:histidinol phosphatase-like PHP family hydrolase